MRGREEALAKALRGLMSFTTERFEYDRMCMCDYCKHWRKAVRALRAEGHGDRGVEGLPIEQVSMDAVYAMEPADG